MLTKQKLVDAVLGEIGLPPHVFDVPPDSRATVLQRIERMIAHWEGKDISVSYVFGGDEGTPCGIPLNLEMAVICNAAIFIAPTFGKMITPETRDIAAETYHQLAIRAATPREMQMPAGMPRGGGERYWRGYNQPFLSPPSSDPLVNSPGDTDIQIR